MQHSFSYHWQRFLVAVMFYTRLPIPKKTPYSDALLNESRTYFPAVGLIVGCLSAVCFILSAYFLPLGIAIAISMVSTILATGAFHEDGFADSCDGFGGGWSAEQVLVIMKDSRLGTYGCLGLICILGIKYQALVELAQTNQFLFCLLIIFSHTYSRTCASTIIDHYNYVQDIEKSKVKPVTQRHLTRQQRQLSLLITTIPLLVLVINNLNLIGAITLSCLIAAIISWRWANYCQRRIGGYTGDTLGAAQQLSETSIYLVFLI